LKKRSGKKADPRKRTRVRKGRVRRKPPSAAHLRGTVNGVFLVGFMGAGKSSVGRVLGQRLNWTFEDLDDRIERQEGRSVAEIFRDSGEPAFRRAEQSALQQALKEMHGAAATIIALGGGAFAQKDNAALLKAAGVPTVFLDAPVEELWQRCCRQASEAGAERPLLQSSGQFRKLHADRHRLYAKASIQIQTGGRTLEAIAKEIAETLGLRKIALRTEQGEVE
jgi:shikimate kinase